MSNLSHVIVSLWVLPVVLQIVLPLAILVVFLGNRVLKKIMAAEKTVPEPMAGISRRKTGEAV
jgi:hypothetical protein